MDGSFYEWDELDEDEYSELEYGFREKNLDGDEYGLDSERLVAVGYKR